MQTLFENEYTMTDDIKLILIKNIVQKRLMWACALLVIVSVGMAVYALMPPSILPQAAIFLACAVVCAFTFVRVPKKSLALNKNTSTGAISAEPQVVSIKFGANISYFCGGIKKEYKYEDIQIIYDFAQIIVMAYGKNKFFTVKKDSFTKGDYGTFKDFLSHQCENAVYKQTVSFILPISKSITKEQFVGNE